MFVLNQPGAADQVAAQDIAGCCLAVSLCIKPVDREQCVKFYGTHDSLFLCLLRLACAVFYLDLCMYFFNNPQQQEKARANWTSTTCAACSSS